MGKSSGGGSTSTQQQTSTTSLPAWVESTGQNNYGIAQGVSQNLMGPYTGQRVADQTSGQLANVAALQSNVGSTNPAYSLAQDTAAGLTGYQPSQVNAGQLSNTDLSAYMNPYTQSVINNGLSALDVQRQQSLNQVGDQAISSKAFGGSRQGIAEGVTNAGAATAAGNLASQLQAANFTQAQAAATGDINRNLTAQQNNQQAGLSGASTQLNAANALGTLAGQGQQSFLTGIGAASAGQDTIQAQQQAQLLAQQQAYQEQQQFPIQQLGILQSALGQTPYGQTTNTTGTSTQPTSSNGLLSGLGAASAGIGLAGQIGGLFTKAAPLAFLSDERMKTDKKKLGLDPETGLEMWSYRYKDDPKSYPKVVGPMAQDVESKYPGSTREIGGKLVISNLGFGHG